MKQFPGIDCRASIERQSDREMCGYYSVRVEITGCERSRVDKVRESVELQWDIENCVKSWDSLADGTLRFVGKSCLYAGERPENFASRLCEAVWAANEGYCDVKVHAARIEGSSAGEGSYTSTRADYVEWKRSGDLPNVRRGGERPMLAAA